jgi:hypothetical protein
VIGKEAMRLNTASSEAFRVPNSIIQGLTTGDSGHIVAYSEKALNQLTAFQMVTLLGLLTLVNPKHPQQEVRTTPAQLLDIIEVSRNVSHAVKREWSGSDGQPKRKQYQGKRHSPRHVEMIHEALLALFNQTVRFVSIEKNHERTERFVHILDTFGYVYEHNGKKIDPHNLPAGTEKINISTEDRPVWRIKRRDSDQCWPAKGVLFRLSRELTRELTNQRGTIRFTLIARRIFTLLRQHMRNPVMIRLIILILRQTNTKFFRRLDRLMEDLGFDTTHPERTVSELQEGLATLQQEELLLGFEVSRSQDQVRFNVNRQWQTGETQAVGAV